MPRMLIGLVGACVVALAGLAGAATAAETYHSTLKGGTAYAGFSAVDPVDSCIVTGAATDGFDGRVNEDTLSSPSPSILQTWVYVSVWRWNSCTSTDLFFAGTGVVGPAFVMGEKLGSATLNVSLEMFDLVSRTTYTADIDLAWTGSGDVISGRYHQTDLSPYSTSVRRFHGTYRDATAVGEISVAGVNFAPEPSVGANLGSVQQGDFWVIR